ncbi:MAG: ATP-binding protein [Defluviitaleaceae bacterium]|nr:ATP-binding protein [Defluviitaleaceae bacterium]
MEDERSFFGFRTLYINNSIVFENRVTRKHMDVIEVLDKIYSPEHRNNPYTEQEYQQDWRAFISLCLTSVVTYKIYCTKVANEGDFAPNLSRTFMKSDEAMNHIGCYPLISNLPKIWLEVLEGAFLHIESRELVTMNSGNIPRPMWVARLLNLSGFAYFAMHCAIACKLDLGFDRVFKSLQGNENISTPTLGIVQTLYALVFPNWNPNWLSDWSSSENRLLFNPISEFDLKRPLTLRPYAFAYIFGEFYMSRELSSYITRFSKKDKEPLYIDEQLHLARNALRFMLFLKEPHLCILSGAIGSGKKLTLQFLAKEEQTQFLLIDLDRRFPGDTNLDNFSNLMEELLFLALIERVVLCFSLKDPESNDKIQYIYDMAKKYQLGIFILTESTRYETAKDGFIVNCIDYPLPDLEKSPKFWELFSEKYEYSPDINWTQIAARYTLTPGRIETAIRNAAVMARSQNEPISEEMISETVIRENTGRLSTIADRIKVIYTWDDLMLDDVPKGKLIEACNRIKQRHTVEIQWGGKFAYGNGVSILLYGPPGTGKTMSAQVIAGELGLPLYRINLAHIVSKYIGETAKNINMVFNEAKSSNVILFFDEADALFAKRTDVKNSNDRHANSESSYLLQKIEEYSGISILATNLANAFDEAFRRRINYMVNIHMPSSSQRLEIWKRCIPPRAPIADDVDLKILADNLEFSGSVIRSAALQAAYFAAGECTAICMKHFAKAVHLELQKLGMTEPLFLKSYLQLDS